MKNLCHFEMGGGGGGVWQMLTSSEGGGRSMLKFADRGELGGGGDKICQNLADIICERSQNVNHLATWT